MDPKFVDELKAVRTSDELMAAMVRFTQSYDFGLVSSVLAIPRPGQRGRTEWRHHSLTNASAAWRNTQLDPALAKRDPVHYHLMHSPMPLAWTQDTYGAAGAGDVYDLAAAHGYKTGVAVVVPMPKGERFLLGIDRDGQLPRDERALSRVTADLQLFAVHAQAPASRLLRPTSAITANLELTDRQRAVLNYTRMGKTTADIAKILFVSPNTVNDHYRLIFRVLDVNSKHLAVHRAIELGLIDPA